MSIPTPPPPPQPMSWLGALFASGGRKLVGLVIFLSILFTGGFWQSNEDFQKEQAAKAVTQTVEFCKQPVIAQQAATEPQYLDPRCVNFYPAAVAKICKGWTPGTDDNEFWYETGLNGASDFCDPSWRATQPFPTSK